MSKMFNEDGGEHPFVEGTPYFIRTITHHYTGRFVKMVGRYMVLTDAAWIADDGRFMNALAEGSFNEVEPYPDGEVYLNTETFLDISEWRHDLPREQK